MSIHEFICVYDYICYVVLPFVLFTPLSSVFFWNRNQDRLRMQKSLMKRQELLFSRTHIGCRKSQVIFHKRATNYRALLRKMTYKDKASFVSHTQVSSPCFCWTKPLKIQQKKSSWRFKCGLTIFGWKDGFHSSVYMYVYRVYMYVYRNISAQFYTYMYNTS